MTVTTTLPKLLRRNADTMPKRPAIREKRQGIWQTFNWAQHDARVQAVSRGLAAHGFRRGHRLAVLGDNRPTLYWALLAAQSLGGVGVPAWPDAGVDWLAAVLGEAGVSVAVAEDDDQVEKLLSICHLLPSLALIVSCGPIGEHLQNRAPMRTFDAIVADGESTTIDVAAQIAQGQPDDPALLLYTTSDSGQPRGVLLSHANLIGAAKALSAAEDFRPTDDCLSFLPMAWIGDALYSTALGLLIGFTCNCPEDPETARRDLRELGPTILLAPPRIWESLLNEIDTKAMQATPFKRRLFNHFRRLVESGTPSGLNRLFGELLIYGPARDQIGLGRTRWAHVGGSTLAPSVARLFRGFGVNLKQSYGPAELSGIVALGTGEPDCVDGPACPGIEMRIARDSEVQVRSPGVCLGYFANEAATRAAQTDDGWWRTGDAGRIDRQGNLIVTGRMSDIAQSDDGTSFAPHEIEIALRGSRFVADVVVPAGSDSRIAAMIVVDAAAAGNWARVSGVAYTTMAELIATPALRQLLRDEVRANTALLPPTLRVRLVALLDSGAAIGTEAGLSRERQRRALLDANTALAEALFRHNHAAGAWVIEDLDGEIHVVQEPADA